MKRKIISQYLKYLIIACFSILLLWLAYVYLFVLSGSTPDTSLPQYLINSFEQYVDFSDTEMIQPEGKKQLDKHHLWAQIVNKDGEVISSYQVPQSIPTQYDIFSISQNTSKTNEAIQQTLYMREFEEHPTYGIIIGADSSLIYKYNFDILNGLPTAFIKIICSFIIICSIIFFLAAWFFSKHIAAPISHIIHNIHRLEDGKSLTKDKTSSIFDHVFHSINALDHQLRLQDEQRKQWIQYISHDIKTPLSSVKGFAEIIATKEYDISQEERIEYGNIILQNADIIDNLVEDLKLYHSLEEKHCHLSFEPFDIIELLNQIIQNLSIPKDSSIQLFSDLNHLICIGEKNLIYRCLLNIIQNALKHNNSVHVHIILKVEQNLKIYIKDDGEGMSEDELKNIFQRYYRGGNSKNIEGSGLGLAISKAALEVHGGSIDVNSKLHEGTTFFITFPSSMLL